MKKNSPKKSPNPPDAPLPNPSLALPHSPSRAPLLWTSLLLILTLLCLRLTLSESVRQPLSQKSAALSALHSPSDIPIAPEVGPTVTLAFALLISLAASLILVAVPRQIPRLHLLALALIFLLAILAASSTIQAANKFSALVASFDLLMALLAGWAVSLLCANHLLGPPARRLVLMFLLALLAVWIAKALLQRYDEYPSLLKFYNENRPAALAQQGLRPGDPGVTLFESRMKSGEITTFISFANCVAAALIGLLAAPLALLLLTLPRLRGPKLTPLSSVLIALLPLGLLVSYWTGSRGGFALALLALLLLSLAFTFQKFLAPHRWKIALSALALLLLASAALLHYGRTHDHLRDKSMTFRWYYWTGSLPIIQQSPLLGIGLGNFGEYYLTTKRPSAPEDVKDPHNTFVRLASELGLPATTLFLALVLTLSLATLQNRTPKSPLINPPPSSFPHTPLLLFLLAVPLWWIAHFAISSVNQDWFIILAAAYALLSLLVGTSIWHLTRALTAPHFRLLQIALFIAALAMLLYDQINMALVTGPVAMLFWILLGFSASPNSAPPRPANPLPSLLASATLLLATGISFFLIYLPLQNQSFLWDPAPHEWQTLRHLQSRNLPAAQASLHRALQLSPRSVELLRLQIRIHQDLHLPLAPLARTILDLDRSNARPRLDLARLALDLPPDERAALLEQALTLDAALAPDEPKKIPPAEITRIKNEITTLRATPIN